jgi:hypothetical protein
MLVLGSTHVPPQAISDPLHVVAQAPLVHTCPSAQTVPALEPAHVPEAPQYVVLMRGSMQLPPQAICGAEHEILQTPLEHTSPSEHAVPAAEPVQLPVAPQCAVLVLGSTQLPAQLTSDEAHVTPHEL